MNIKIIIIELLITLIKKHTIKMSNFNNLAEFTFIYIYSLAILTKCRYIE